MKAVIMAGGEGTRLRPVNHDCPKPMVRLLDRPLMEHIIGLLKSCGICDICVTLRYMPEMIRDYFGDGSRLGVRIKYQVEGEPLGTAGGVRACESFTGNEDFLVISGDAACDFDLALLIDGHRKEKCAVTMALYPHPDPLQYGLVLTSPEGRVISFIEKPPWERVVTDLVNTGIYVVSAKAMEYVPRGSSFDFAKDLFPLLMKSGESILGIGMEGYWCDVGNPQAYLRCSLDALAGRLRLGGAFEIGASGSIRDGVRCIEPCYISRDAEISAGAAIGPNAVIGAGSRIGTGSTVSNSVVDGASLGAGCRVDGAVLCKGAALPKRSRVKAGEVVAPSGFKPPEQTKSTPGERRRSPLMYSAQVSCGNRAKLMRALSESLAEFGADFSDGLSISTPEGGVHIAPKAESSALIVEADRRELCDEYAKLAKKLSDGA